MESKSKQTGMGGNKMKTYGAVVEVVEHKRKMIFETCNLQNQIEAETWLFKEIDRQKKMLRRITDHYLTARA